MFIQGQKVVCINDDFPAWARALYDELPVKDKTYTIRAMGMGLDVHGYQKKSDEDKDKPTVFIGEENVLVLLKEIKNPDHPISKQEMGFLGERFAPMQELDEEQIEKLVRKQENKDAKEKEEKKNDEIWVDPPVVKPERELVEVE